MTILPPSACTASGITRWCDACRCDDVESHPKPPHLRGWVQFRLSPTIRPLLRPAPRRSGRVCPCPFLLFQPGVHAAHQNAVGQVMSPNQGAETREGTEDERSCFQGTPQAVACSLVDSRYCSTNFSSQWSVVQLKLESLIPFLDVLFRVFQLLNQGGQPVCSGSSCS